MAGENSAIISGNAINEAYGVCDWADSQIEALLEAINFLYSDDQGNVGALSAEARSFIDMDSYEEVEEGVWKYTCLQIGGHGGIDPQDGAGTLIIDRLMSELSNLESISANAIATMQRIQKEINSKLS